MGTLVAAVLLVPLVMPGYLLGSWRLLRRTRGLWEVAAVMFVPFMGWYVLLTALGGSRVLAPVAILACAAGFGAGRASYLRDLAARRREATR